MLGCDFPHLILATTFGEEDGAAPWTSATHTSSTAISDRSMSEEPPNRAGGPGIDGGIGGGGDSSSCGLAVPVPPPPALAAPPAAATTAPPRKRRLERASGCGSGRRRGGGRVTFAASPQLEEEEDSADREDGSDSSSSEPWPESLHRHLVEAIYEVGLKHASPAVIMEMMGPSLAEDVTSERVKSHLQKYRNNREKNKEDFMREYDEWVAHAKSNGLGPLPVVGDPSAAALYAAASSSSSAPPERLHGADRAASLTRSVLAEQDAATAAAALAPHYDHSLLREVPFPVLTDEEKCTPLGEALTHAMQLFRPLAQCLRDGRHASSSSSSSSSSPPRGPGPSASYATGAAPAAEPSLAPPPPDENAHRDR